jgi:hypothetical protein
MRQKRLLPLAMHQWLTTTHNDERLICFEVPPGATGQLLGLMHPVLERGYALYCIDGGNHFDPRLLALLSEQAGTNHLLERVYISRAYTCFQFLAALELLPLEDEPACLMVLGVDHLFLKDELPVWERRFLFSKCQQALHQRQQLGAPILVTYDGGPNNEWARRLPGFQEKPPFRASSNPHLLQQHQYGY